MTGYDDLPPVLRVWLAAAALPWSPRSVRKTWDRVLRQACGDTGAALAGLDALERARLARDARQIWGPDHPAAFAAARHSGADLSPIRSRFRSDLPEVAPETVKAGLRDRPLASRLPVVPDVGRR
jgi:hypothetical protein